MLSRTLVAAFAVIAAVAIGILLIRPRLGPAPHAIVLVRHAEKADQSADTALSPAGEARALHLAEILGGLGVRAIYTSEFKRTAQTAQPTAQRLGLTPVVVPAQDTAGLVQRLHREHPTDNTLIVGHADTLPELIRQLGVKDPVDLPGNEYGNLYIVVTHPTGPPTLLRLHY